MADPISTGPSLAAIDPLILNTTGTADPTTPTTIPTTQPTADPTTQSATPASTTEPQAANTGSTQPTPSSNGNQVAVLSSLDYSTHQSVTTVEQVTTNTVTTINNNMVTNVTNNYYSTPTTAPVVTGGSSTTAAAGSPTPTGSATATGSSTDPLLRRAGYRLNFNSRQYGEGGRVDRIIGFNMEAGDQLTFSAGAFPGIEKLTFRSVSSRRSLRKAARTNTDILYLQSSGELFFNANSNSKGFGSDGGLFAVLEQKPALSAAQLLLA